jgi:hypothetical protein
VYFDGLMENMTRGRKLEDPGTATTVSLHPMATPQGWREALAGKLWTWNAFSRAEPLTLSLEIAIRDCGEDRTQIFYAFSQAERGGPPWEELRAIRAKTGC